MKAAEENGQITTYSGKVASLSNSGDGLPFALW